jgi:hypothetical protein
MVGLRLKCQIGMRGCDVLACGAIETARIEASLLVKKGLEDWEFSQGGTHEQEHGRFGGDQSKKSDAIGPSAVGSRWRRSGGSQLHWTLAMGNGNGKG